MLYYPIHRLNALIFSAILAIGLIIPYAARAIPQPLQLDQAEAAQAPASTSVAPIEWLGNLGSNFSGVGTDGFTAYAAGTPGLTVLDVHDPAQPVRLGSIQLPLGPGPADIFRVGPIVYVAAGQLYIIGVHDPAAPRLLGRWSDSSGRSIDQIWVVNSRLYGLTGTELVVLNVGDPASPTLISSFVLPSQQRLGYNYTDLQVSGTLVSIVGVRTLSIVDVADPAHPYLRSNIPIPTPANFGWDGYESSLHVVGSLVYTLITQRAVDSLYCDMAAVSVIDIRDPDHPIGHDALAIPADQCEANIRVIDGLAYLVGPGPGVQVIDVRNPDQLVLLRSAGNFRGTDLRVAGGHIFVASLDGLHILDIRTPDHPTPQGRYTTFQISYDIQVVGPLAYIASGTEGLSIVDVSNPRRPIMLSRLDTPGVATNLDIADGLVYLTDGMLRVIDVHDPRHPVLRGSLDTPGTANDVQVVGHLAYLADGANGLQVVDVSNPAAPVLRGHADAPEINDDAKHVVVELKRAYISGYELQIYDLSSPTLPILLGRSDQSGDDLGLAVRDGFAYALRGFNLRDTVNTLDIYDVRNPASPVVRTAIEMPIAGRLFLDDNRLYVYQLGGGVDIYDLRDPILPARLAGAREIGIRDAGSGIAVVGDLIYLASGGLTILENDPAWFESTTTIPATGGSFTSADGSLHLSFPPGASSDTLQLTYQSYSRPRPPLADGRGAVRRFNLKAQTESATPITQLVKPYTMVLSYTQNMLATTGITDETSLNLVMWNGTNWANLLPCAGCTLDPAQNRVTVRLTRFGTIALAGRRPTIWVPVLRR